MTPDNLWAGALSLLLRASETGCPKSVHQAADLLDRLADSPDIDNDTRNLFQRASDRLGNTTCLSDAALTA